MFAIQSERTDIVIVILREANGSYSRKEKVVIRKDTAHCKVKRRRIS